MGKYSYHGLSEEEVDASRKQHGSNSLPPPKIETFWEKLLENFQDPLIKILCLALVITICLSIAGYADWLEGIGIAAAVFLATFVSTWSEFKNESSFQEQQVEASKTTNHVFRMDTLNTILSSEIVVGDLVLLQLGDKVPADGVLVDGEILVNQSALNGEPDPVPKRTASKEAEGLEREMESPFIVFRGSLVEEGEAVLRVDRVGNNTVYGKIYEEMSEKEDRKSPLQVKLGNLADGISNLGYVGATFIAMSFLFKQFVMDQGYSVERITGYVQNWQLALNDAVTSLILAIIIIVVAVPEGLPMMIAIVLSLNMRKLLQSNVLVRRLLGIETAGSLNILFSDKTGTLTKGHLEGHLFITGAAVTYDNYNKLPNSVSSVFSRALLASTSCHVHPDGTFAGGNASDRAFLTFLSADALRDQAKFTHERGIVFSSARKFSSSQVVFEEKAESWLDKDGRVTIVKGAPELILSHCSSYLTEKGEVAKLEERGLEALEKECSKRSHTGIRVVAISFSHEHLKEGSYEMPSEQTLIGVIGVLDAIRPEAAPALQTAKSAGIQVVMITGDRKETAVAVARYVGLLPQNMKVEEFERENLVLTSDRLKDMSDERLSSVLPSIRVIARALPADKSRLVKIAQAQNLVVGMTGDGVNDSPALKRADVGFGMGSGTEVAKEASDIVILDDNIMSVMSAVLYGRTIFKSIRKFIVFQSTVNLSSSVIVFLGPFMGFDFPLTLIQLLWVNLVMDTLAALAFGGEAALASYMREKPIKRSEAVITPDMWSSIVIMGLVIAAFSITFLVNDQVLLLFSRDLSLGDAQPIFLTAFFSYFIFLTNFNAFNVRTPKVNVLNNIGANYGFLFVISLIFFVQISFTYIGGSVLRTVPLRMEEWMYIILASVVVIPIDMIRKWIVSPFLPKELTDLSGLEESKQE